MTSDFVSPRFPEQALVLMPDHPAWESCEGRERNELTLYALSLLRAP